MSCDIVLSCQIKYLTYDNLANERIGGCSQSVLLALQEELGIGNRVSQARGQMFNRSHKVFFGWWIVGASVLISLYTAGVVLYGFTLIFEPIANEFGWSYTQISLAASLRGMETGLLAPILGILADRWGPRRLVFGGVVIASLGLMLLGRTASLSMFYGAFVLVAIGMSTCSSTVLMTAVVCWFQRKVGIATGIAACGFGLGGLLIPIIVTLIAAYEWRMSVLILALGMLTIGLPLSLVFRHKPEQYNYLPDGELPGSLVPDNGLAQKEAVRVYIGVKSALKSSTFWHIAVACMCHLTMVSAVITHVMPYLSSIGIARVTSSLVATATPLTSVGGRLGFGWLGDRFDKRRVMAAAFAITSLGLLCFEYASTGDTWLLVCFIILFGIGYGSMNPLRASMVREFFGRSNFGAIHGFIIGIAMLGSIAGPPLAGWVYDNFGSYQGIWFVFAGLAIVAVISVLIIPPVGRGQDKDKRMS